VGTRFALDIAGAAQQNRVTLGREFFLFMKAR
jgi:hypothetical protein